MQTNEFRLIQGPVFTRFLLGDDIKEMAVPVLEHRVILRPEFKIEGVTVSNVIERVLQQVAVPR